MMNSFEIKGNTIISFAYLEGGNPTLIWEKFKPLCSVRCKDHSSCVGRGPNQCTACKEGEKLVGDGTIGTCIKEINSLACGRVF